MQTKSKQKAFFYGFTHLFSADLGWIGQNFKALKADLSKEFHAKSKALRLELDKDYQKEIKQLKRA